jgi:hypothetical protein
MMRSVETYGARLALAALCVVAAPRLWAQGPPYQTDDPVPVDLHHYEFYIFGGMDGTTAEIDSTGPAIEFNWGAIAPSNNPIYLPGGTGPKGFRADGHGTGHEDRFHQGVEIGSPDRRLHDVRDSDGKLRQRPRRGEGLV